MSLGRVRGPGEPDQLCDLVAAAIVEEYLRRDPGARLKIRVTGGYGALFVAGEVLSTADFDVSIVVRRTLGQNGLTASMEPFIALEALSPAVAPEVGSRSVVSVMGYATDEMSDRFPKVISWAREAARELERRRTGDPDWFWLGFDYTVTVHDEGRPMIVIQAEHLDHQPIEIIRERIQTIFAPRFPGITFKINPAGEGMRGGLAQRIGASGRSSATDVYGNRLPVSESAVGLHLRHPAQLGQILCRAMARELIEAKKGKAILVQATWLPFDAEPYHVRIRNEKGEDLSSLIALSRFHLARVSDTWLAPTLSSAIIRAPFDGSVELPWEK